MATRARRLPIYPLLLSLGATLVLSTLLVPAGGDAASPPSRAADELRAATPATPGTTPALTLPTASVPGEDPVTQVLAVSVDGLFPGEDPVTQVLAVSVDGLNPRAIRRLGPQGAPAFHRLMRTGAYTLNARTLQEHTTTLPNHTAMLTGRRVDQRRGGHGVTFNRDDGTTVHRAAGRYVPSVFDVVHDRGGRTALFTTKTKFAIYERTWNSGGAVDRVGANHGRAKIDLVTVDTNDTRLVAKLESYLRSSPGRFTFLHISVADRAGHEHRFMSERYLTAVERADRLLGTVLDTVATHDTLRRDTLVLVTADHAGSGESHSDARRPQNYRIPFLAWGPGVPAGRDLYSLNPTRRSPGQARTDYSGRQPIRNGDLANLTTDLLGLPRIPGSELNVDQTLTVVR